jgi:hypothetical protein
MGPRDCPRRDADRGCVRWHVFEHDRAAADLCAIPDCHRAQYFRSGAYYHAIADGWVALPALLSGTTQGYSLVDRDVVPHNGRFANHHAHSVIDEKSFPDHGARVNLDSGQKAAKVRHQPRPQHQMPTLKCGGEPVKDERVKARIRKDDLYR